MSITIAHTVRFKRMKILLPQSKPVKIGFTIYRKPFRELIQNPGYCKPDLTYNRYKPQGIGIFNRICYTIVQEYAEDKKPQDNDHSVRVYSR